MNEQQLFILANSTLHKVVQQITEDQLDMVVPDDASWMPNQTLREMLNIFAYENRCVPEILAGQSGHVVNAEFTEDLLQSDFQANYAKYSDAANEAAKNLADPGKIVHISYGDFAGSAYLSDITIQRGLGAYDLAELVGVDAAMPPELVEGLWKIIVPSAALLREYGVFKEEVSVAEDAPLLDRLLGLTGRQPR